ncbi:hypothetical protein PLESTF_001850100 [Pleodorina starrii]|nr:hypothetical protein PLESTM_000733800 [Pleodorina starrii]GLC76871.1 hypothetical protein PLESTF_001850100 [Pleodorina starrii]
MATICCLSLTYNGARFVEAEEDVAVAVVLQVCEEHHQHQHGKTEPLDFSIERDDSGYIAAKTWATGETKYTPLPHTRAQLLDSAERRSPECWKERTGDLPAQIARETHGDVAPLRSGSVKALILGWEAWAWCQRRQTLS